MARRLSREAGGRVVTALQFSRGVGRTLRAMEREAQRAERQRVLQAKAAARQAMLNASADAAETYQHLVELLTACHKTTFGRRDWTAQASAEPPEDPVRTDVRERTAAAALSNYAPGWFARTFGVADKTRAKLRAALDRAKTLDQEVYDEACEDAARRREAIAFAQDVLALKSSALVSAVNEHAHLDEAPIEAANVLAIDGRVIVVVDAMEVDDMPAQSVTLLQSGKASFKNLAASKILEMHRDNVCSAAVRVAVEFLQVLPIEAVEVLVETDLLDRGSGHISAQPVLYLRTTAQALSSVNLVMADATPLAERLGAHFDWSKRDGFRAIQTGAFDLPLELLNDDEEAA